MFRLENYTKVCRICDFGSKLEILNVPIDIQQHSDMEVGMSPNEPGWLIQDGCVIVYTTYIRYIQNFLFAYIGTNRYGFVPFAK